MAPLCCPGAARWEKSEWFVRVLVAGVKMEERQDVNAVVSWIIKNVGRDKVEVGGVEIYVFVKG
jgi:hypothetical protein